LNRDLGLGTAAHHHNASHAQELVDRVELGPTVE
jgi:hypothetical protein